MTWQTFYEPLFKRIFDPRKHLRRRDVGGRGGQFASPGGAPSKPAVIYSAREARTNAQQLLETGGFSYQPRLNTSPHDGYMLSIYPDREHVVAVKGLTAKTLSQYVQRNADVLTRRDHYLGGWVDQGKAYLDVSVRVVDRGRAAALARRFKQKAFYDLKKGESVYL